MKAIMLFCFEMYFDNEKKMKKQNILTCFNNEQKYSGKRILKKNNCPSEFIFFFSFYVLHGFD